MSLHVGELNALPSQHAEGIFLSFLGSRQFAALMCQYRPFSSVEEIIEKAEHVYNRLLLAEWQTAFGAHLRIGQKGLEQKAAIANAAPALRNELIELVRDYEDKFGFKFLVFAPGKTAEELLAVCKSRINNAVLDEWVTGCRQAADICNFRIRSFFKE